MPAKTSPEIVAEARRLVEEEQMTQRSVEALLGIGRGVVGRWAIQQGWKTQRTGPRAGAGHPDWKGGRLLLGGYWYIYSPDHPNRTKQRRVAEHRLVMEAKLGRYLERSEVVHHLDGNPQNNHPDNLELFQSNADHLRAELTGRCPNWTPEGQERIALGVRKAAAIHRHIKSDDDLRILGIDRQQT